MTPERNIVTDAERTTDVERETDGGRTPLPRLYFAPLLRFLAALLLVGASMLFVNLAAEHPAWIADSYVRFSRGFQHALGAAFGLLPFSVVEFVIYALILGIPAAIAAYIVLAKRRGGALRRLAAWLSHAALVASILLAVFLTTWSVNYHSAGLGYALSLEVTERSSDTLAAALAEIVDELNAAERELPRDDSGAVIPLGFDEMSGIAADAWLALADAEPYFADVQPTRVKPVAASYAMSAFGITGIYMPLSGEANVNTHFPDSAKIFTMAHELAHSFGVAPENEANFAAYLACRASGDPYARYAGYLSAFVYCYNALVGVDEDAAFEQWYELPELALAHLRERSAYWKSFESPVKEVGSAVNDAYLKTMSQTDGVKSYGRVVDLILADYVARNGCETVE